MHRTLVLALAGLVLLPASARATDYYVSTTGNDANDCVSAASPCATPSGALALAHGNDGADVLHLAAGDYGLTSVSVDGSEDDGLVVRGEGATPNDTRIFSANLTSSFGNAGTVTFRNLKIQNAGGDLVYSKIRNVLLEDVRMVATGGNSSGQLVTAIRPANQDFENVTLRRVVATTDRPIIAVQLDGALLVEDSAIDNTAASGPAGIAGASNGNPTLTVRRSRLSTTSTASGSTVLGAFANNMGVPDITVDSSVLQGGFYALQGSSSATAGSGTVDITVRNSTVLGGTAAMSGSRTNLQANAIKLNANSSILSPQPNRGTDDGNYVTATCAFSAIGAASANALTDCTGIAFAASDFAGGTCCELKAGSPEIDSGDFNDPAPADSTTDVNGNPRRATNDGSCTFGGRRDIGAVEYQGGVGTISPTITVPDTATAGKAIDLTAGSDKIVEPTYTWDFGDGTTGAGAVVSHTFAAAATRTVTLKAVFGPCVGTTTKDIAVSAAPAGMATPGPGGTATPTPGPSATPTATPTGTPTPPAAFTLTAKLKKKTVKRGRKAKLVVTVSKAATLKVTAKRGKKPRTLIKKRALKAGRTTVTLATKKLGRGKVTLTVSAGGVKKTLKLKIRR